MDEAVTDAQKHEAKAAALTALGAFEVDWSAAQAPALAWRFARKTRWTLDCLTAATFCWLATWASSFGLGAASLAAQDPTGWSAAELLGAVVLSLAGCGGLALAALVACAMSSAPWSWGKPAALGIGVSAWSGLAAGASAEGSLALFWPWALAWMGWACAHWKMAQGLSRLTDAALAHLQGVSRQWTAALSRSGGGVEFSSAHASALARGEPWSDLGLPFDGRDIEALALRMSGGVHTAPRSPREAGVEWARRALQKGWVRPMPRAFERMDARELTELARRWAPKALATEIERRDISRSVGPAAAKKMASRL